VQSGSWHRIIRKSEEAGLRIWEWVGQAAEDPERGQGTMHSKFAVFDGQRGLVGSYNLDPRSEKLNSETAMVFEQPELAGETRPQLLDAGGHLPSHVGGEGRDGDADDAAIALRIQSQIAGLNRLFDVLDGAGVEGADDDLVGLGGANAGQCLDRSRRSIHLDPQRVDETGVGPTRADAGEGVAEHVHGLLHPFFSIEQNIVGRHGDSSSSKWHLTRHDRRES
jgi:hypothetical protein